MRKRLFEIIEKSDGNDKLSTLYDYTMIVIITLSLIPLLFKHENAFFSVTDKVTAGIFIVDYLLRLATADYKFEKEGIKSVKFYGQSTRDGEKGLTQKEQKAIIIH